jgi:hypothetical protein
MTDQIRDLEHRVNVAGRAYVLQVCVGAHSPTPVSAGPFDVMLFECVSEQLLDHEDDEPEKVLRQLIDDANPFMPDAITVKQWSEFSNKVYAWVCEHRAAASIRDQG